MTGWPDQPVIYEMNTAVWLDELARTAGTPVTLGDVPARPPGTRSRRPASMRSG